MSLTPNTTTITIIIIITITIVIVIVEWEDRAFGSKYKAASICCDMRIYLSTTTTITSREKGLWAEQYTALLQVGER